MPGSPANVTPSTVTVDVWKITRLSDQPIASQFCGVIEWIPHGGSLQFQRDTTGTRIAVVDLVREWLTVCFTFCVERAVRSIQLKITEKFGTKKDERVSSVGDGGGAGGAEGGGRARVGWVACCFRNAGGQKTRLG